MKQEVNIVFNNFMQRLQDGEVQDDDSLLVDSTQGPDKEAKQILVQEQRIRFKLRQDAERERALLEE
jgi:hypothetical protein